MVYPGRPSKGCGICRKRHVKCDEGKPKCANCNKRGLSCSGYREWGELHIRNQTLATTSRFNTHYGRVEKVDSNSSVSGHNLTGITLKIEDLALQNFFANFVRPHDPSSVHKGYFQVLPGLFSSTTPSSALHSATSAFALATFRVDAPDKHCVSESRKAYALSLRRIQQELQSEPGLRNNETFLAVLLMQVVEALLESESIEGKPESHLDGAMTLVKIRGRNGFEDETSQSLLSAARAQGIMRSFGRSLGLETTFSGSRKMYSSAHDHLPDIVMSERPFRSTGLLHLISQVAELLEVSNRVHTLEDSENYLSGALDLIDRCNSCDFHLAQWAESSHASWQCVSTVDATSNMTGLEILSGRSDTYNDVFIARSWNYYRVARIFIQVILMRYCIYSDEQAMRASLNSSSTNLRPRFFEFQQRLMDMVNDVCASIPFHLGRCAGHKWSTTGIGAYFLMWPLLLAQEALPDNSPQKFWMINQLLEIGRDLSISQTKIMCYIHEVNRRCR